MSDSLYELLQPHFPSQDEHTPKPSDNVTTKYLARLPKLDLAALQGSEPQSLAQASQSSLRALQALSSRSAKTLIASSDHFNNLSQHLPSIEKSGHAINSGVSALDSQALAFSTKYSRSTDNPSELLDRRKRTLLLARNVDRVGDILELPSLLASAVNSAAVASAPSSASGTAGGGATGGTGSSAASLSATYNAALDLHGHVKRLSTLHPNSKLVEGISRESTAAMRDMTTGLIQTLRGSNLKLAGGMRTIGWLRRVAPELAAAAQSYGSNSGSGQLSAVGTSDEEGAFGALFLVCRLMNLSNTLEALEPLKNLADQETTARREKRGNNSDGSGHQTERYIKRFIELFREQSFGVISMFRSIFPAEEEGYDEGQVSAANGGGSDAGVRGIKLNLEKIGLGKGESTARRERAEPLPSALATFPLHLIEHVLLPTLRKYLPNVADRSARESLLTQVLYCAGSLGRLGGDFSILLTTLYDGGGGDDEDDDSDDDDDDDDMISEWVDVMKKHRVQAARLESLATSGTNSARSRPMEGTVAS